MGWLAHTDTQGFGLGAAGYGAAIIVAKDNQRGLAQLGLEYLLTAGVEVVAVNEGEHGVYAP
jgi:hypothetical protein